MQQPHGRMLERTLTAFTGQHTLCRPAPLEIGALHAQLVNEVPQFRIVRVAGRRRPKFSHDAAGAGLPIQNERAGLGSEKDVAQEIWLPAGIEPAREQPGCLCVPSMCTPGAIEYVGGTVDRIDAGEHGIGRIVADARPIRIALAGEFEQVASLCPREAQSARQASKGRGGDRYVAALLDPRVPRDAQSAELGDLLAPEPRRATPIPRSKSVLSRRLAVSQRP